MKSFVDSIPEKEKLLTYNNFGENNVPLVPSFLQKWCKGDTSIPYFSGRPDIWTFKPFNKIRRCCLKTLEKKP